MDILFAKACQIHVPQMALKWHTMIIILIQQYHAFQIEKSINDKRGNRM